MKIIKNIQVPSKSGRMILLDAYHMDDNIKKQIVIFLHGYKSFKDWGPLDLVARYFARKGCLFIKFNFSHNGTNPKHPGQIVEPEVFGRNTLEIELANINEVIDWVGNAEDFKHLKMEKNQVTLIGHSRGGSEAILVASRNKKVKSVVSWAGFKDFEEVWRMYYDMEQWERDGVIYRTNHLTGEELPLYYSLFENYRENRSMFDIEAAVKKLKIPVMLIHGTEDRMVPYEHALTMKKWNKSFELNIIPGASHVFGGFHPYKLPFLPNDTQIIVEDSLEFIMA